MGWWRTVTPTEDSSLHERSSPASSPALEILDLTDGINARLLASGKRLIAALDAEHQRSNRYPTDFTEVVAYLEEVSILRQRSDECAREYSALLAEFGFASARACGVIECRRVPGGLDSGSIAG